MQRWAILLFSFFIITPLIARSWDDLYVDDKEYYGKEREEKFPIRLFIWEKEKWENHYAWHFLFLLRYTNYPRYSNFTFFPLYSGLESKLDSRQRTITPFFFKRSGPGENDFSALWLYYSGYEDKENVLPCENPEYAPCKTEKSRQTVSYRAVIPLFYHTWSMQDSITITPLFFYTKEQSHTYQANWLWVNLEHSLEENQTENSFWFPLVPLFYKYKNTLLKQESEWITPFLFYRYQSANGALQWFLFPVYFYSRNEKQQISHYSPFYVDTRKEGNGFWGILPLFIQYKDEYFHLHLNIAGLSVSKESVMLSAEIEKPDVVIDSDFAWLYSALRFSFRVPVAEVVGITNSKSDQTTEKSQEPDIVNSISVKRADSHSFFGYYLLFGLNAYERANDSRHFRLLPLSWFTWNRKNENAIYVIPPVLLWYNTPDLRYKVLFPVFGSQFEVVKGKTKLLESWFAIAYIKENDETQNRQELSVIWPFYNSYTLAEEAGHRLFPIWWYKKYMRDKSYRTLTFSPMHYYEKTDYSVFFLSPLYFHSGNSVSDTIAIFPLYLRHARKDNSYKNFMIFPWYSSTSSGGENTRIFFPLFASFRSPGSFSLFLIPHYHHSSAERRRENTLWLVDWEKNFIKKSNRFSFFFGALHSESAPESYETEILYGLALAYHTHDDGYAWSGLTIIGSEKNEAFRHHRFFPIWWYTSVDSTTPYYDIYLPVALTGFFRAENKDSDWYAFGLLAYRSTYHGRHEGMFHLLSGALYYQWKEPEREYRSAGSLWGLLWHYEEENNYNRFSLLKFLYSRTVRDGITRNRFLGIPF